MPDTYHVPEALLRTISQAAQRADIHEVCFVVFGRGGRVQRVLRVRNRAKDTVLHHVIREDDYARARRRGCADGLQVLGLLHTHPVPPGSPSEGDVRGYRRGQLIFIYAGIENTLRAIRMVRRAPGYLEKAVVIEPHDSRVRQRGDKRGLTQRCRGPKAKRR